MTKRIAFVGAGAIGGYIGANLTALGHDVTLIDPWPAHVEAMRANGMHLYGMTEPENCVIRVNAMHVTDAQQLAKQRPIDIAFIAVKSYDTVWATRMIRQYLSPGGFVVSSQNCINEERIAGCRRLGPHRRLRRRRRCRRGPVRARPCPPFHAKNPNVVSFHVGEPHGRITRRVEELAEMLNGIDNAHATDNLWGERWTKLCVNGMRNGVSAATGLGGNARDSHDAIRRICIRLGGESVRVGQALGFKLGKIGALAPEKLALAIGRRPRRAGRDREPDARRHRRRPARSDLQRPSMAQDMAKGRRTEIEFMNGFIAEKGAEVGVTAPTHAMLTEVVMRVERGEIAARPGERAGECVMFLQRSSPAAIRSTSWRAKHVPAKAGGPPSTTCICACGAKPWMPTFVGMTVGHGPNGGSELDRGEQEDGPANHAKHANPGHASQSQTMRLISKQGWPKPFHRPSILRNSRDLRFHFLSYFDLLAVPQSSNSGSG